MAALAIAALTQVRGHVKDQQKTIKVVQGRLRRWAKPVREALVSLVVILVGPLLLVAVCALGVLVGEIAAGAGNPIGLGPLGEATPALLYWVGGSAAALFILWHMVDLTSVSLVTSLLPPAAGKRLRAEARGGRRRPRGAQAAVRQDRPTIEVGD